MNEVRGNRESNACNMVFHLFFLDLPADRHEHSLLLFVEQQHRQKLLKITNKYHCWYAGQGKL